MASSDGFSIDLENSDALLALSDLQRKQLPFAQRLALTRTAQAAQREIKKELPGRFTLRSNFVERGVKVQASTKRSPEAAVFWRAPGGPARRAFAEPLARQEEGGIKSPRKKFLAIPRKVKRGKGGRITKSNLPSNVLKRKRVFIGKTRTAKTLGIYERGAKARYPIKILYLLTPRAVVIDERFEFVATAELTARRVYKKEFGKAFAKALATAR